MPHGPDEGYREPITTTLEPTLTPVMTNAEKPVAVIVPQDILRAFMGRTMDDGGKELVSTPGDLNNRLQSLGEYAMHRGWTASEILRSGAAFLTPPAMKKLLGKHHYSFGQPKNVSTAEVIDAAGALVIPRYTLDSAGEPCEIAPQLRAIQEHGFVDRRFASAAGERTQEAVYKPSLEALLDPDRPTIICEGASKLISLAAQVGVNRYGLVSILGCDMGTSARGSDPATRSYGPVTGGLLARHPKAIQHKVVYLLLDGDFTTNHRVARALDRLAAVVGSKAMEVRVIVVPDAKSVDDFLGELPESKRAAAAEKLIADAKPWRKLRGTLVRSALLTAGLPRVASFWDVEGSGISWQATYLAEVFEDLVTDPTTIEVREHRGGSLETAKTRLHADNRAIADVTYDGDGFLELVPLPKGLALFEEAGLNIVDGRWTLVRAVLDLASAAPLPDGARAITMADVFKYLREGDPVEVVGYAVDAARGKMHEDDDGVEYHPIVRALVNASEFSDAEGDSLAERMLASGESSVVVDRVDGTTHEWQIDATPVRAIGLYECTTRTLPSGDTLTTSTLICEHVQIPVNVRGDAEFKPDGSIDYANTVSDLDFTEVLILRGRKRYKLPTRMKVSDAFSTAKVATAAASVNVPVFELTNPKYNLVARNLFQRLRQGARPTRGASRTGFAIMDDGSLGFMTPAGTLGQKNGVFTLDESLRTRRGKLPAQGHFAMEAAIPALVGQSLGDEDAREFLEDALALVPNSPDHALAILGSILGAPSAAGVGKPMLVVVGEYMAGKSYLVTTLLGATVGVGGDPAKAMDLSLKTANSVSASSITASAFGYLPWLMDDFKNGSRTDRYSDDPSEDIFWRIGRGHFGATNGEKSDKTGKSLREDAAWLGWPIVTAEAVPVDASGSTRIHVTRLKQGDADIPAFEVFEEKWRTRGPRLYWTSVLRRAEGLGSATELSTDFRARIHDRRTVGTRVDTAGATYVAGLSYIAQDTDDSLRDLLDLAAAQIVDSVNAHAAEEGKHSDTGWLILEALRGGLQPGGELYIDGSRLNPKDVAGITVSEARNGWPEDARQALGYKLRTYGSNVELVENRHLVGFAAPDGRHLILTGEGLKTVARLAEQDGLNTRQLYERLAPYVAPGTKPNSKLPASILGTQSRGNRFNSAATAIPMSALDIDMAAIIAPEKKI